MSTACIVTSEAYRAVLKDPTQFSNWDNLEYGQKLKVMKHCDKALKKLETLYPREEDRTKPPLANMQNSLINWTTKKVIWSYLFDCKDNWL